MTILVVSNFLTFADFCVVQICGVPNRNSQDGGIINFDGSNSGYRGLNTNDRVAVPLLTGKLIGYTALTSVFDGQAGDFESSENFFEVEPNCIDGTAILDASEGTCVGGLLR